MPQSPKLRKTRNPAQQLSQMAGRIVCTVGRAAPTGCLRCFLAFGIGIFSRMAQEARDPLDDETKN
jgi:hypothetical protein